MNDSLRNQQTKMLCLSVNMEKTGANIKRLFKERGYSVEEIMAITGISTPQAIYKWFRGKSIPSIENLAVLSEVMGINIKDILIIERDK